MPSHVFLLHRYTTDVMSRRDVRLQLEPQGRSVDRWQNALMACTALVLAAVMVKCIIRIWPNLYWDWDPRSPQGQGPITGLGPGGLAWLNAASVLLSAVAISVHMQARGRVAWHAVILVMIGAAFCAVHMPQHAENMRLGGSWIAAATLALAALHLAEHERPRRYIAAALVALLVPLALQAMWYVWVEHPATLKNFLSHEAQILQARGIAYGSPQHHLFAQRMTVPDAIGAFALSNVFGSVLAGLTLAAAVIGALAARGGRYAITPVVVTLAGFVAVILTRSKGAATAMLIVAALIGVVVWMRRAALVRRALAPLSVALIAIMILVVLGRSALGPPPTRHGEKSLLFRSHYWQSAARMIQDRGMTGVVLGLGPEGFTDNYPQFKNRINPEQVTSAHNVLVDYMAMLGLGGVAWGAVLLGWVWAGACRATSALDSQWHLDSNQAVKSASRDVNPSDVLWALLLAVPVFATQFAFQHRELDLLARLIWLLGVGGFIAVTVAMLGRAWYVAPATRVGLFAAALLLMLHNQIDMTFHLVGGSAIAWLTIAAAAAQQVPPHRSPLRWTPMLVPGVLMLASIVMVIWLAVPVTRQQQHLAAAAAHMRATEFDAAANGLEKAIEALPNDPGTYRSLVQLLIAQRRHDQAEQVLDQAKRAGLDGVWRLKLLLALAQNSLETSGPSSVPAWTDSMMTHLLRRRPFDLQSHLRVAELNWQLGNRDAASNGYRRCLELNEGLYLQPAWQLSGQQREHIEKRLNQSSPDND